MSKKQGAILIILNVIALFIIFGVRSASHQQVNNSLVKEIARYCTEDEAQVSRIVENAMDSFRQDLYRYLAEEAPRWSVGDSVEQHLYMAEVRTALNRAGK